MDVIYILNCKLRSYSQMDKEILDIIEHDPRLRMQCLIRERLSAQRSLLSIAREFHCCVNTVRRYARGEAVPGVRKTPVRTPTALTAQVCRASAHCWRPSLSIPASWLRLTAGASMRCPRRKACACPIHPCRRRSNASVRHCSAGAACSCSTTRVTNCRSTSARAGSISAVSSPTSITWWGCCATVSTPWPVFTPLRARSVCSTV